MHIVGIYTVLYKQGFWASFHDLFRSSTNKFYFYGQCMYIVFIYNVIKFMSTAEKNRNKSRSKSSNKKVFSFTPFLFTKVTTS